MFRCVLFDIDNTLLLKKPSIPEMVFQTARPWLPGLEFSTVEKAYAQSELWQGEQIQKENETGIRMSDEEYLQNVLEVYQRALGLAAEACGPLRAILMRNYHMDYEPAPGAADTLAQLRRCGMELGIVSNNTPRVRTVLAELGLAGFFDSMVISEEVGLYKPDPKIMELACEQLGVPCTESVYIGDHPFDVLCAHAAHMPVIWLPANRFMALPAYMDPPEHTVQSLAEILPIITR